MFEHTIHLVSSNEPLKARGFLAARQDSDFVQVQNDKGHPVLIVAKHLVASVNSTPVHEVATPGEGDTVLIELTGTVTRTEGDWVYVQRNSTGEAMPYPGAINTTHLVVHKRFIKDATPAKENPLMDSVEKTYNAAKPSSTYPEEIDVNRPRKEFLFELLYSIPREDRKEVRFILPERYRNWVESNGGQMLFGKPIRLSPHALTIRVERHLAE